MKRSLFLGLALTLAAVCAYADCPTVTDPGHLMGSTQPDMSSLVNLGVHPAILLVPSIGSYRDLGQLEAAYESQCPDWRDGAGHRRANLMVFVVAVAQRSKNVFFGSAVSPALKDSMNVNVLYSKASNPYFAHKQWAEGFTAASREFASTINAYHDESIHPKAVVNQATDLTPVEHGFLYLLVFLGLLGLVFLVIRWDISKREAKQEIDDLRRNAKAKIATVTSHFLTASQQYESDPRWAAIADLMSNLRNKISWDPDQAKTKGDLEAIISGYTQVDQEISRLQRAQAQATPATPSPSAAAQAASTPAAENLTPEQPQSDDSGAYQPTGRYRATPRYPEPQQTVTVNSNSGSDLATGILLGEAMSQPTRETVVYEDPAPRYTEESRSSDSDSSWSDNSSSTFDSGNDSGFGSSDFGGGGDFSSGSDSGF